MIIQAAIVAEAGCYIAAGDSVPIDDVAALVEEITGTKLDAEYVDLAPGLRDPLFETDNDLLRAKWTQITSLEADIRKVVEMKRAGIY